MRRAIVALLVAALVTVSATACADETPTAQPPASAARPQSETLDWNERYAQGDNSITFAVRSFEVLEDGWRAGISMTNGTKVRFTVDDPDATVDRAFGVMLFRTGDLTEVEQRTDVLSSVRRAERFQPPLPLVLEPGKTWSGTIGARGSLAAGRWMRVVFGPLVPVGDPPEGFPQEGLVWITDHALQLK